MRWARTASQFCGSRVLFCSYWTVLGNTVFCALWLLSWLVLCSIECLNLLFFTPSILPLSICVLYPMFLPGAGLYALSLATSENPEDQVALAPSYLSVGSFYSQSLLGSPLPTVTVVFGSTGWACHYCGLLLWGWGHSGKFWVLWLIQTSQALLYFLSACSSKLLLPCDLVAIDGFSPNCSDSGVLGDYHLILVKMVSLFLLLLHGDSSMGIWGDWKTTPCCCHPASYTIFYF